METICKKCVERGGKRWNPIKTEEYKRLFAKLRWFSDVGDKRHTKTIGNIVGELQLLELINRLHSDCELENKKNFLCHNVFYVTT